eukprot:717656_1
MQLSEEKLHEMKRKELLRIIKRNGFDNEIEESLQKGDGTLAKNLKKEIYVQLILDQQDEPDTFDHSESHNSDTQSIDLQYPNYVTFEAWMHDHIEERKHKYGVGVCWDLMEHGMCYNSNCSYQHPRSSQRNRNHNQHNQSSMTMYFGKHKGKLLHEIPRSYVLWMERENVLDDKSANFVREMRRVWSDIFI